MDSGPASVSAVQNLSWLNENTLTYSKTLATKHNLTALLGYTTQGYHVESVTASAINLNDPYHATFPSHTAVGGLNG